MRFPVVTWMLGSCGDWSFIAIGRRNDLVMGITRWCIDVHGPLVR
jgi:hypothetical protein